MGMDFNYQAAHAWFLNLDKLVRLLPEAEPGLAVFYSTPACYLAALHGAGLAWPAKQASASKSSIRRFVISNHGEGPYKGLLLVESGYYRFHI